MTAKDLIVALDFPSPEPALSLATTLAGHVRWVKVGLELFCRTGPAIVARLNDLGFKVFLDLKFMDIPNTVKGAVASAAAAGADMLTIHLMGGGDMAAAALEGAAGNNGRPPVVIGVTVLTSMGTRDLAPANFSRAPMGEIVQSMALQGYEWGLDGIVCSGQEVERVRERIPRPFTIVTPGIRLDKHGPGDQKRVTTPSQALSAGTDYLVVGRPITRSSHPLQTAQHYLHVLEEDS
ncbi:orotidine-5'-phosphate decarboxylase [Desulfoplanes sp.]